VDVADSLRQANERTLVIALIESETGIANADDILAVPGIDVGWLGHYDLTDSLGIPGRFDDPRFTDAVERLVGACRKHSKAAGFMDADLDLVRSMMAKGFRAIGYGTDIALIQAAYRDGLARLRT
jgi:2-keto-3-deoxy-L-rhamnonate aldolase RhmA